VRDELLHFSAEQVVQELHEMTAFWRSEFFLIPTHRPSTKQTFKICKAIVDDYKKYLNSFTNIMDNRIHEKVQEAFEKGTSLPAPFSLLYPYVIFRIKVTA